MTRSVCVYDVLRALEHHFKLYHIFPYYSILVNAQMKINGGNYLMLVLNETIIIMLKVKELYGSDHRVLILFPWLNCRYAKNRIA
jgi:hypothetical protein